MIDHNEAAAARQFEEPFIFPEEDELLGVLEDAGVPSEVYDKAVAILRRVLEREAEAKQQSKSCTEPNEDSVAAAARALGKHISELDAFPQGGINVTIYPAALESWARIMLRAALVTEGPKPCTTPCGYEDCWTDGCRKQSSEDSSNG